MTQTYRRKGEAVDCAPYHYTQCGLDDIYLVNGFKEHETGYGAGVSIQNAEELHQAIAYNLCFHKAFLNGKEFRFLRKLMDLTQSEIAVYYACDAQTIARWEKGETDISGAADRLIRILFLEHMGTKKPALEIIEKVSKLDSNGQLKQMFRETKKGWKAA